MANYAAEVEVDLLTNHPVKEQQFSVRFRVQVESNDEVYISFDPKGVEVLGKRDGGFSSQTTIINGKIQTKRERTIIYDFIAEKSGEAWLRNILVEVGTESIKHPHFRIKVFNFARKQRDMFVQAEMVKENLYLGEGVDVRYYLYHRIPVVASEVKKFPVFNGFLKRDFIKQKSQERVNFGGRIYEKVLVYSVRLYPEKVGTLTIDQITLNVIYENRSSGFPFGSSPFFGGQRYSKSLMSEKKKVNILPLPQEGFPENFTGLVGKHSFKVNINKTKFLVNEAIELSVEARGKGALEKLELPSLYDHPELEDFNSTSDLNIGANPPFKKVDYTYLGRSQLSIPERKVSLAYFDPELKQYKKEELIIPGIIVAGGNFAATSGKKPVVQSSQQAPEISNFSDGIVAPLFMSSAFKVEFLDWKRVLSYVLIVLILLLVLELVFGQIFRQGRKKSSADVIYRRIRKKGLSYSDLYALLLLLFQDKNVIDLSMEIKESSLPNEMKDYFLSLLERLERHKFSSKQEQSLTEKPSSKMFKKLINIINENNKIPSGS